MNQADVTKLISRLRFKIRPEKRKLPSMAGPMGRLDRLSTTVTALIKYERIELNYQRADEARGYAERLISEAIRHGDQHDRTMEMADFWIKEKSYIHKLFKVLVPRFQNSPISYTRLYKAPRSFHCDNILFRDRAVLELRGNPFPALKPNLNVNRNFIHNVLLEEAKKEYRRKKYAQLNEESAESTESTELENSATKIDPVENVAEQLEQTIIEDKKLDKKEPMDEAKLTK